MKLSMPKFFRTETPKSMSENVPSEDDVFQVDVETRRPVDPSHLARAASFEYPHHAVSSRSAAGVKFR